MTTGFMQGIGIWELVIILVVILIIFGPGKLPEVGKALGKSLRSFKDAQRDIEKDIVNVAKDEPEKKKEIPLKSADNNGKPE
jgi:sec-independent protein translocase protein TatA